MRALIMLLICRSVGCDRTNRTQLTDPLEDLYRTSYPQVRFTGPCWTLGHPIEITAIVCPKKLGARPSLTEDATIHMAIPVPTTEKIH